MMIDIVEKTRRIIYSCETPRQAEAAARYVDLVAKRYPHIDVWELRKELSTLFSNSIYESV